MSQNSSKIVLFDIDHTIFDTRAYVQRCFEELEKIISSKSRKDFKNLAQEIYLKQRKHSYFSPKRFSEELKERIITDQSINTLENVFYNQHNLEESLYKDVLPTMRKLSQKNIKLGIFSAGDKILQKKKLQTLSHILHENIVHIFERDKHEAIREVIDLYKTQKLYVVDDLLSVLAQFKAINPEICTIWVVRSEETRLKQKNFIFNADHIIHSLSELLPIVAN